MGIRLLFCLIGIGGILITSALSEEQIQKKIAVVDFEGINVEEPTARAVTEMIRTQIASEKYPFTVLERGQVGKALQELGYQKTAFVDTQSAVELGKHFGASFIVVGSVTYFGRRYVVNARIINVETLELLGGIFVEGKDLSPFLIQNLSRRIQNKLALLFGENKHSSRVVATGLVIDTRHLNVKLERELYPKIITPSGTLILGNFGYLSNTTITYIIEHGMVLYASEPSVIPERCGSLLVWVKAKEIIGSHIVIGEEDAKLILETDAGGSYLRQFRIVVLVNG